MYWRSFTNKEIAVGFSSFALYFFICVLFVTVSGCGGTPTKMSLDCLDDLCVKDMKPGESAFARTKAILVYTNTSIYLDPDCYISSKPPTDSITEKVGGDDPRLSPMVRGSSGTIKEIEVGKKVLESFVKIYRANDGKFYVVSYGPHKYVKGNKTFMYYAVTAFAQGEVKSASDDDVAAMFGFGTKPTTVVQVK
jgi:hypothetical protein